MSKLIIINVANFFMSFGNLLFGYRPPVQAFKMSHAYFNAKSKSLR